MPDPNDILGQIQLKIADVARSKTALGYNSDTMAALGMIAFGRADELRDAIQAPDGQSWRSAMFQEAARRLPLEEEIQRLRAVLLNIQAKAESGFVFDSAKLATRCRRALSRAHGQSQDSQ